MLQWFIALLEIYKKPNLRKGGISLNKERERDILIIYFIKCKLYRDYIDILLSCDEHIPPRETAAFISCLNEVFCFLPTSLTTVGNLKKYFCAKYYTQRQRYFSLIFPLF